MPNTREKLIDAIEKEKPYLPTEDYEVGYNNGLTMAQTIILATGNNVGHKWISVKDRLPEIYTQVLCFTGSSVQLAMYEGNDKWFTDYHSYTLEGKNLFTHWMPLPQPPKGE